MKPNRQRWYWLATALFFLLSFLSVLAYVGWKIAGSNLGKAGRTPGLAIAGELSSARLRNMEQWCTGVVKTSTDVWLVGRTEDRLGEDGPAHIPADSIRLGASDHPDGRPGGLFGRGRYLTTISRLQDDGMFNVEATVSDIACLAASPASETLYLFTWLSRPDTPASPHTATGRHARQDMVFRSTDQGRHWEWVETGFMAEATSSGASLRPTFASDRDVWVWGDAPDRYAPAPRDSVAAAQRDERTGLPTNLFYSSDAGQTSVRLYSPEALEASDEHLLAIVNGTHSRSLQRFDHDTKRFVVQVDDVRAYAWVVDLAWYRNESGEASQLAMTSRADLARPDPHAPWEIMKVSRQPGARLDHVTTSADRQTHAVLVNEQGQWLTRLDAETGEWIDRRPLPSLLPEWLVGNGLGVRYFWSNGDYQVISLWGDIEVPRIMFPFTKSPASMTTDAHFYTDDGGRSWHQLAIPGYLGVLGLATHDAELFWSKGNWYTNDEPYVWRYDLARQ